MRHARKLKFWKRPAYAENMANSLADAYVSLPAGMMLVYDHCFPGEVPHSLQRLARETASRLGGALVQFPECGPTGNGVKKWEMGQAVRQWVYAIQKPTGGVA